MTVPLIIDTDPGIDDAVALALAVTSPEVELRAVTTVYGNVGLEATTVNARRVLALAGRSDVPVAAGAARPLVHPQPVRATEWHGADGLGGLAATLPEPGGALDPRGAVALMADVLRAADRPVTIVPIGPLTNVALLLAVHPELRARIGRIVVMGGAFAAGNTTAAAEFNIYSDPEAAHRVLTEPDVPVTLVPLDLTLRCAADGQWLDELAAAGPRSARLAGVMEHSRRQFHERYGRDSAALHDSVAVFEGVCPGTLSTTPTALRVTCDQGAERGATVRGPTGPPVDVAVDADIPALHAEVLRRLAHLDG